MRLALAVLAALAVGAILASLVFEHLAGKFEDERTDEKKDHNKAIRQLTNVVAELKGLSYTLDEHGTEGEAFLRLVHQLMESHVQKCEGVIQDQAAFHASERISMEAQHSEEMARLKNRYEGVVSEQAAQVAHYEWLLSCSWTDPLIQLVDKQGPMTLSELAELQGMDSSSSEFRGRMLDAMKRGLLRKDGERIRRPQHSKLQLVEGPEDVTGPRPVLGSTLRLVRTGSD